MKGKLRKDLSRDVHKAYMYYREHAPPHFHAEYGEFEITVEIESGVVSGRFPRRALGLVLEWCVIHTKSSL